jgi:ribose/xylose/arabinose/galactoside ABC-type transport system permease subunit
VVAFIDLASRKEVMIGLFLATVAGAVFVLNRLPLGRHIYAIGGNEQAAWLAGIPVARVKMIVYTSMGMLVGLAGIIFCARNRQGNPNEGFGYELDAIAAVVVGGTRLTGGQGSVFGTLIGVLILGIIVNIMGLNNVPSTIQQILKGAIIVGAVWLQQKGTVLAGRAGSRGRVETK